MARIFATFVNIKVIQNVNGRTNLSWVPKMSRHEFCFPCSMGTAVQSPAPYSNHIAPTMSWSHLMSMILSYSYSWVMTGYYPAIRWDIICHSIYSMDILTSLGYFGFGILITFYQMSIDIQLNILLIRSITFPLISIPFWSIDQWDIYQLKEAQDPLISHVHCPPFAFQPWRLFGSVRLACLCWTSPGGVQRGATGGAAVHGGAAVSAPWRWGMMGSFGRNHPQNQAKSARTRGLLWRSWSIWQPAISLFFPQK